MKRGHTVTDTINATKIAKESGLKICYHIMPGLPGSNKEKDLECFLQIFENQDFKPDMIKIYPTLTIQETELYKQWKQKKYKPLSTKQATELIAQIKEYIPEWIRIQRIQRDVPSQQISAGVTKSNLRQLVEKEMKTHGTSCKCIRCREIGHQMLKKPIEITEENLEIVCHTYQASDGNEIFLTFQERINDYIIGYLRLRDIILPHRYELQKHPCMMI